MTSEIGRQIEKKVGYRKTKRNEMSVKMIDMSYEQEQNSSMGLYYTTKKKLFLNLK